jgi:hypothetical protein
MPKRAEPKAEELLQKLLIVQLGLAGIQQRQIQKILGISINEVNSVVKLLKRKEQK